MKPEELSERLWRFAARVGKVLMRCLTLDWAGMLRDNLLGVGRQLRRTTTRDALRRVAMTSPTN
jgi:hypothetical protein